MPRYSKVMLLLFALAACCIGCGRQAGGDLLPVVGRVTLDKAPLPTGAVSFRPDAAKGNQSLHHPTGSIDREGRYELFTAGQAGAPPGWYKVVVHATEPTGDTGQASPGLPKSIIDLSYNDPITTPLAVEVVADATAGHYDLHLDK